jgi:hypothetical protein
MFNGIDPFSVLGASGTPEVPGLGFRFDTNNRWPYPNPTGLTDVMEGFCPPHFPDMRAAVHALCERKFGRGGPFNADTPGPWKDTAPSRRLPRCTARFPRVRGAAGAHIFDTFGKFRAQFRRWSPPSTSRRTTSIWNSTIGFSNRVPIFPRTPITSRDGTGAGRFKLAAS